MATQTGGSDFTNNLGKVYTLYTGGFAAFVILVAILEQFGVPNHILGYMFVFFTIGVYALIGVLSRTMQVSEYYVAGRRVPAFYNGMATAADWMSAASFIGMAGTLYALGYDGLAFILGWTGGYVLVAILVAPYLRKFGAYTVPDFLYARYGGKLASMCGIIVLLSCSFTYVVAQIVGTGLIAQRFLGMDYTVAVYVGLVGILVCSMLGGMRAVTWTQVAQYIVLIVAYLLPVVILSAQKFGIPLPQIMYGQVLQEIAAREQAMVQQGLATAAQLGQNAAGQFGHTVPWVRNDFVNYFSLILCLMIGTASLPHVLMRFFTTPSVREARVSVAWTLLFIFILYFTAPAYAAFAKLEVFTNVIGHPIATIGSDPNLAWVFNWGKIGLVKICGVDVTTAQAVADACSKIANHPGVIRFADLRLDNDAIVIATPEIAGLPYVIAGLVAAGGLAAALSTADGLLLAIANALSHDIYYKMIDPNAPTARRLVVARVLLVIVAVLAAYVASFRPADIVAMVAWAFSLAAAGLFPALVLGIWWKRTTSIGAIAGILAGFGVTLLYLVATRYYPVWGVETLGFAPFTANVVPGAAAAAVAAIQKVAGFSATAPEWQAFLTAVSKDPAAAFAIKQGLTLDQLFTAIKALPANMSEAAFTAINSAPAFHSLVGWFMFGSGIRNISAAMFGLPIGFAVMVLVSLVTPAPSKELQAFIDEIRKPRGGVVMKEKSV
jgi:cation/acetate symporter